MVKNEETSGTNAKLKKKTESTRGTHNAGADGGIVRDGVCLHPAVCHAIKELQSARPVPSLFAGADGGAVRDFASTRLFAIHSRSSIARTHCPSLLASAVGSAARDGALSLSLSLSLSFSISLSPRLYLSPSPPSPCPPRTGISLHADVSGSSVHFKFSLSLP